MRFFEDESCGQCTPCRVGTQKAAQLMESGLWARDLLEELSAQCATPRFAVSVRLHQIR
jgi:NADH:ubiquinone oxidoreductase subunit F (NADH-binding)